MNKLNKLISTLKLNFSKETIRKILIVIVALAYAGLIPLIFRAIIKDKGNLSADNSRMWIIAVLVLLTIYIRAFLNAERSYSVYTLTAMLITMITVSHYVFPNGPEEYKLISGLISAAVALHLLLWVRKHRL